jgi:hypothetical protein
MTASPATAPGSTLAPLRRFWWVWVVFGLLTIAAGIVAMVNPGLSLLTAALLFSCYPACGREHELAAVRARAECRPRRRVARLRRTGGLGAIIAAFLLYQRSRGAIQETPAAAEDLLEVGDG